jgi:hypothetical protein
MPLRVWYGMTFLLIRGAMGGVRCSDGRNWCSYSLGPTWCKRGRGTATTPGKLSIAMVS